MAFDFFSFTFFLSENEALKLSGGFTRTFNFDLQTIFSYKKIVLKSEIACRDFEKSVKWGQ